MKKYIFPALALVASVFATSCENDATDFPDYEGGVSVYFPYQYPVRTIMLGNGINVDNSADKAHKFTIKSTMGGAYDGKNIKVNVRVAEDLLAGYCFEDGVTPLTALPHNYYNYEQVNNATLDYAGTYNGGVEVQLTDAFFADPKAVSNTYILPLQMVSQVGADTILASMNYTFYCVRFVNALEGYYLVSGTASSILESEILQVKTASLNKSTASFYFDNGKYAAAASLTAKQVNLELTLSDKSCTVTGTVYKPVLDAAGENVLYYEYEGEVTGNGTYTDNAVEVAPNLKTRDQLELKMSVAGASYNMTLVMQRRGDFDGTVVEYAPVQN